MEDQKILLSSVLKHVSLSQEQQNILTSSLKTKMVKRKEVLLNEGDIQRFYFFVISGCLRSYSMDKAGFEYILQFAPKEWWIGDVFSIKYNEKSRINIDAVFDSKILLISNAEVESLFEKIPPLERYFRILAERAFGISQRKLIEAKSLSALERYKIFRQRYPEICTKVPKKLIASYLGIRPEFLSKMIKNSIHEL